MKESYYYRGRADGVAVCGVCQRRCAVVVGELGVCRTRKNLNGKLYSLIYARIGSISVNPIEKKPVYHFLPGSRWLSLGTLGCNFHCPGCQNWELSHVEVESQVGRLPALSPAEAVAIARKEGCVGISWTFNEPTIWFEYTLDGAIAAKRAGLFTNYVTNGSITPEALDAIGPYLDVFRVDLKAYSREAFRRLTDFPNSAFILAATERAQQRWGMHVEVVTNVISGVNDAPEELRRLATWIVQHLGRDTPWHITRFYPHLSFSHYPVTPLATLEAGQRLGQEAGLRYVYLGNVPGHAGENTYCPQCQEVVIGRYSLTVTRYELVRGRCRRCGMRIAGLFWRN